MGLSVLFYEISEGTYAVADIRTAYWPLLTNVSSCVSEITLAE